MTYQEKRILNNSIILKIYDDEILNVVFRLLNKNPKDLYKYVQIVKKSLLTLNDDEIFLVIKKHVRKNMRYILDEPSSAVFNEEENYIFIYSITFLMLRSI